MKLKYSLQINIDYTLQWLKNTQDQGNSIFTICNILKLFDVLLIYMGDSRINRVSQEDINTLQDKLDILKREHAIALNEVKQLQHEYSAAVAVRQKLAREYNKLKDYNYMTLPFV